MSQHTAIAWTDHTFNIAWGCHEVSPGCDHCYAKSLAKRYGHDVWGPPRTTPRRLFGVQHWREPLTWNRQAEKEGRRRRVFCSSMADVFESHRSIDHERDVKLWPLIRATPWLDWQILTKRPERIKRRLPSDWGPKGYPNVWLGTSVENQDYTRRAFRLVMDVVAPVLFLSVEPMLSAVDLSKCRVDEDSTADILGAIDWVIVGGESGPRHRPADVAWIDSLVAQCRASSVPVFVKQDSGPRPGKQGRIPDSVFVQEMPTVSSGRPERKEEQ